MGDAGHKFKDPVAGIGEDLESFDDVGSLQILEHDETRASGAKKFPHSPPHGIFVVFDVNLHRCDRTQRTRASVKKLVEGYARDSNGWHRGTETGHGSADNAAAYRILHLHV